MTKTGSDTTRTGSQDQSFLTVQKAIDACARLPARSVTIHIGPGR